jgi:hypothetical protein
MRHAKLYDNDDDLGAMRGIGLALVVGLVLWAATTATVSVGTRSSISDTQTASSHSRVCSDVGNDSLTSVCN